MRKKVLLLGMMIIYLVNIYGQGHIIKGKVKDENSEPLAGVTIVIVGSTKGVITDIEGKYSIEASPNDKLVYSFIGMNSVIEDVNGRNNIDVTLTMKSEELDEVTVVAFGKQKKESVVGAITTINPTELKVPSSNLTTALAGRMTGIISYQRSGEPGQDNAEFFIRGVTTFGYKKDPLILIDNVEFSSEDLAKLNTDDIASFSIMKDATATALYGARGANGVILITTKEGKEGKAKFSIRMENSFSTPTKKIELADPITYMHLHNEAYKTRYPLSTTLYSVNQIEHAKAGTNKNVYPTNDWYTLLFKDYTQNQRVNFNVNGGGKVARYYVAGSYTRDNGVLKVDKRNNFNNNINLNKYLLRSNININVTEKTEIIARFHGTFDDYSGPVHSGSDLYGMVMNTNPVLFPAYHDPEASDQIASHILFGNADRGQYTNPYAEMVKGYKEYSKTLMMAQFELKQDLSFITEGLNYRFLGNTNRYSFFSVSRAYNPYYYKVITGSYDQITDVYQLKSINPDDGTDYLAPEEILKYNNDDKGSIFTALYLESALTYNRDFNLHGIGGLVVMTLRNEGVGTPGSLEEYKTDPEKSESEYLELSLPYRNIGISGRFTYGYADKYFTEFNFGYNGSERFAKNERFGFFPSVGIGWALHNENFWNPVKKIISKFKLTATYGLVGNDAIGHPKDRFFYISEVNMNTDSKEYTFGSDFGNKYSGIAIKRYPNDKITWEKAAKSNLALQMTLFENINFMGEVFHEYRTNILQTRQSIPTTAGLQETPKANIGEASGRGVDLSVDYSNFFTDDLWLTVRGNFTYATSKFEKYEEPDFSETPWLSRVGHPINQKWGYIADRLFIDENDIYNSPIQFGDYMAGDIKYRDVNNDGKISELDMVPIGYPTSPEIVYGFGFSVGYKSFDFSTFLQGLARESFWIDFKDDGEYEGKSVPFIDDQNALLKVYADNYWSEDNRDIYAIWPRLSPQKVENNSKLSTWSMQNGAFLRVKSVEIGYNVQKRITEKIRVKSFRIYASGTNLLTFSKFKFWDPEMAGNGFKYPIQKVYNIGIQINL